MCNDNLCGFCLDVPCSFLLLAFCLFRRFEVHPKTALQVFPYEKKAVYRRKTSSPKLYLFPSVAFLFIGWLFSKPELIVPVWLYTGAGSTAQFLHYPHVHYSLASCEV